jgi:hypothetical protein
MNTSSRTRRVASFAAAAVLLTGLAETPAHAITASPVTTTDFNGAFSAVVTQTGPGEITGDGTSSNSPLGLVSEHFVYTAWDSPIKNKVPFVGFCIFSTLDGTSTLYASVAGTYDISNYTGRGLDTFNSGSSSGIFKGAYGNATFEATVPMNIASAFAAFSTSAAGPAPNNTQQFHDGLLTGTFDAVPETSSVVSLGVLLMLGGVGVVLTARKKRIV